MIGEFNKFLNDFRKVRPLYRALGSLSGFNPREHEGKIAFDNQSSDEAMQFAPAGYDKREWAWYLKSIAESATGMLEGWVLAGIADQGVKIFCPTLEECRALARIDVNIRWQDYRQPFDTFGVILPTGWHAGPISSDVGVPIGCFSRLNHAGRLCSMVTLATGGTNMTGRYVWKTDATESIESHWNRVGCFDDTTEDEEAIDESIQRILINACLMLVQSGFIHKGKSDPAFVAAAQAKLKKKNLPASVRAANEAALALAPDVYGFDQHIRLYDEEGDRAESTGTGLPHKPHWRRGHWANQAHGVGHQLRKLIFRRPVLVNSHRFAGDLADTRVSMTMAHRPETTEPK